MNLNLNGASNDWLLTPSRWRNRLLVAYFGALAFWFAFQCVDFTERAMAKALSAPADGTYISDYMQYYVVDKILCSPDKGRMYQIPVQRAWQHRLLGAHVSKYFAVENSPIVFLFMMPLSLLPMDTSQLLWQFLSLAYASFFCWLLAVSASKSVACGGSAIGTEGEPASVGSASLQTQIFVPAMIVLGVAGSAPSHIEFEFGQVSYFVLGSAAAFFYALLKKKDGLAGFFLALASVKMQIIPLLVLACIPNKQFKVWVTAGITIMVLVVLTGFSWGWSNYLDFPTSLVSGDKYEIHKAMPCLRGLLCWLGMDFKSSMQADLAVLFFAFAFLLLKGWGRAMDSHVLRLWCALLMTLALLLTPHCFANYSVLLAATAALILPEYFMGNLPNNLRTKALVWLLLLAPVFSWVAFILLAFRIPETFEYTTFDVCVAALLFSLWKDAKQASCAARLTVSIGTNVTAHGAV